MLGHVKCLTPVQHCVFQRDNDVSCILRPVCCVGGSTDGMFPPRTFTSDASSRSYSRRDHHRQDTGVFEAPDIACRKNAFDFHHASASETTVGSHRDEERAAKQTSWLPHPVGHSRAAARVPAVAPGSDGSTGDPGVEPARPPLWLKTVVIIASAENSESSTCLSPWVHRHSYERISPILLCLLTFISLFNNDTLPVHFVSVFFVYDGDLLYFEKLLTFHNILWLLVICYFKSSVIAVKRPQNTVNISVMFQKT